MQFSLGNATNKRHVELKSFLLLTSFLFKVRTGLSSDSCSVSLDSELAKVCISQYQLRHVELESMISYLRINL